MQHLSAPPFVPSNCPFVLESIILRRPQQPPSPAQSQRGSPPLLQLQSTIAANGAPLDAIQNPVAIGVLDLNSAASSGGDNSASAANESTRETGLIEKLLYSYGFIHCCDRQARLFFHFSQFRGNIDNLKVNDPVEFEMSFDRRTGKPVASHVSRISPEVVLSEERVNGTVTTELHTDSAIDSSSSNEATGRISYENRGEFFFLPYTKDDVEDNVNLHAGDKVSFQIATNQRGNIASHVRLENPSQPVKRCGVVCSMKESFGFIERADIVKEIFFHFSETEGDVELRPGDDVEFTVQTRNGREYACNITRLPPGSVIFEDIDTTYCKGIVLKPLDRNLSARQTNEPLPGRIRYRASDYTEVEVPFCEKDQVGDFTLCQGDWVQFLLATDRRDQLQLATSISLLDETFKVSDEKREQGIVVALKDGFGFIRCVERTDLLFFYFNEILDVRREVDINDEVEFTVIQEPGVPYTRMLAIRVRHLPPDTVQFETLVATGFTGCVTREAQDSSEKSLDIAEGGVITYEHGDLKKSVAYLLKNCEIPPKLGDRVRFDIFLVRPDKKLIAGNVQIRQQQQAHLESKPVNQQQQPKQNNDQLMLSNSGVGGGVGDGIFMSQNGNMATVSLLKSNEQLPFASKIEDLKLKNNNLSAKEPCQTLRGFIAVLKENFGFIENLSHDQEVFFHFSNYAGNPSWLDLGQEVEYTLSPTTNAANSGSCLPAENVRTLPKGSIPQPAVLEGVYNGVVARSLRCINPEQTEYSGLILIIDDASGNSCTVLTKYEFGITSLVNKRDFLQKDDLVTFKIDETGRAAEVTAVRQKETATVDSIKGQFGFLNYEIVDGKKLFFHISEVRGSAAALQAGDTVEFSIVTNQRNGKSSACSVVKIDQSPDRLISRLKLSQAVNSVQRFIAARAPKCPQGKGFSPLARLPHIAGTSVD